MNKESLPQWGWLLIGLMVAAVVAEIGNTILGVATEWNVVTVVALMAPILIYVGIWHDDDRQYYWEHSRARIAGDVAFIVVSAAVGAGLALALIIDFGLHRFVQDIVSMISGFVLGWALFWWRNPEMYRAS